MVLAPLAGITDTAYRKICRDNGADVVYTEMTSIDALYYDSVKTMKMLEFNKKEKPVVLQLFGKRPELIKKAVAKVEEAGFSGIDINFGCPAKKVVAHGGGVTLLRNLALVKELVYEVCKHSSLPVSVKTRVSINTKNKDHKITVLDFIDVLQGFPVSTLMLHGRSYEQGFVGEVDWDMLQRAREKFNGTFIANGGVNTPEDAKIMLDKVGADGLGIARGVYGRPWIFQQIKDYLDKGKYKDPTIARIKKIAIEHAKLLDKSKGQAGIYELRKHLCWYVKGFPNAAKFRSELVQVESVDDVKKILKKI